MAMSAEEDDAFEEPMDVRSRDGSVVVLGPDGLCAAFTPEAAERSGLLLIEQSMKAREHWNPALSKAARPSGFSK